jgi:AmiR/NasT family two-component response regulator
MFVALTAYSAKLDIQRAKDAGFHHHIVKPMSYEALQEVLDAATATRLCDDDRLQRELKFQEH